MDKTIFEEAKTPEEVIGLAVGAGSGCWEDLSQTGVFDDQRARWIVDSAVEAMKRLSAEGKTL